MSSTYYLRAFLISELRKIAGMEFSEIALANSVY